MGVDEIVVVVVVVVVEPRLIYPNGVFFLRTGGLNKSKEGQRR